MKNILANVPDTKTGNALIEDAVLERVREAVASYNLTWEEITSKKQAASKTKATPKSKAQGVKAPARVKGKLYKDSALYSDGVQVWKAHGSVPRWLKEHAAGRPLSQFEVTPERAAMIEDRQRVQAA